MRSQRAIGLSGLFSWDSGSNYTGGTPRNTSTFNALTLTAVPEPSSLVLIMIGLATLIAGSMLKRRLRVARNLRS